MTLNANRYVHVDPSPNWCGGTDVTVRATDAGGLSDTDTFRVAVSWSCRGPLPWYVTGEDHCTVSGEYSADDVLTFTPEPGFLGGDTVTLHMVYPWGNEATQALTLTWDVSEPEPTPPEIKVYLPLVTRD